MSNIDQDQPMFEFFEDDEPAKRPPVFIDGDEFVDAPRTGSVETDEEA